MAATTEKLMTIEEFAAMADDDMKHELIDGRLITTMPPGRRHGAYQARLMMALGVHIEREGLEGEVLGEVGFRVEPGAQTVRAPDVSFSSGGDSAFEDPTFGVGAPDLAIEVTSPGDRHSEVQEKALMWLGAGTRLVLVVDPEARTVTAYRAADAIRVHRGEESVDASDVVPGWRLALPELFR